MDPDALLAITGGLAALLGALGTWLRGKVRKGTDEANAAASTPARVSVLEGKWEARELEEKTERQREHVTAAVEAAVEAALAERDRRELEDSSPASSQIMARSGE